MRAMLIGSTEIEKLHKLRQHAEANPYSTDDLLDISNGHKSPPGLVDEFCCDIPFGFKVVYTIDVIPEGKIRHLSMSVKSDNEDEVPDPAAVEGIMKILGFAGSWDQCQVKIETLLDGGKAVEVGQLIQ